MLYAHTGGSSDDDWQPLIDHLLAVADRAERAGAKFGAGSLARLAGLLHDLGKYHPDFQRRLRGAAIAIEHSGAGARRALEAMPAGQAHVFAELVAHAIAGHHAGLPDRIGGPGALDGRLERVDLAALDPAWTTELPPLPGFGRPIRRRPPTHQGFTLAFLGRMIFSCLIDADRRDTEAYCDRVEGKRRDRDWPALGALLPELVARLDAELARKAADAPDTDLNRLRGEVLAHVRGKAGEAPGLFTLTVPTGGGKTLTSLAFALDHARAHGLDRIIYAIPFTSVIDQTAAIFRDILGDEVVLEHHSAIDETGDKPRLAKENWAAGRDKLRLAMEDWAAPVVVTTTVQLFESLFSDRPSRCRKLHNIARSVIVLDEAQTLPRPLTIPILRAIEELAAGYGCTVVLCTATQPAFGRRDGFPGLDLAGRELAPDPEGLARRLKRTRLEFAGPMDTAALVTALGRQTQALVIVNSRTHALDLFKAARAEGLDGLVHLTTRHYAVHRRRILADVRQRLKDGLACRVIATSLVEAGVDVDFPRVFRAAAGLDQIAQAAGRCNRENRRPVEDSIVTVFDAEGYPPPCEIDGLIKDFKRMRDKHGDLFAPAALADYFEEVFWRFGTDRLDHHRILDQFRYDGALKETCLGYRSVGESFRMIESGLAPVIVPGDEVAQKTIGELGMEAIPSGALARALQGYVVQVPPRARALLLASGDVAFAAEAIRGDQFAVLRNPDRYTPETGLYWDNGEYLAADRLLI